MVGARFPGVTLHASSSLSRRTLYWQRTKRCAVMTPRMRDPMRFTIVAEVEDDGCFDLMRTAELSSTVAMDFNPAARMVSPDSGGFGEILVHEPKRDEGHTNEIHNAVSDS